MEPGDQAEIQSIKIKGKREITLFNCYCPPGKQQNLDKMAIPPERCIVLGDFNSHSPSWGYPDLDLRGEEIENWQIENRLLLLNHPDDQPTFYSRRWRSITTPDLGFSTDDIEKSTSRTVLDQLAGSDHRPILIRMQLNMKRLSKYVPPRWNFKRANWAKFSHLLEGLTAKINPKSNQIDRTTKQFQEAIKNAAKQSIPRGSRKTYTPYWNKGLQNLHSDVTKARYEAETNPSEENNIALKAKTAKFRKETIEATKRAGTKKQTASTLTKTEQNYGKLQDCSMAKKTDKGPLFWRKTKNT